MDHNTKAEICQRLHIAQKRTQDAYAKIVKGYDLHPGTQIAQLWPFITAAYCGIEQSFKFLIASQQGITPRQLYDRSPRGSPFRGHSLAALYRELVSCNAGAQSQLENYYRKFVSLHEYITAVSVEQLLQIVSRGDGRGYEAWRYALTEPPIENGTQRQSDESRQLPPSSAEALLAVWKGMVQILEAEASPQRELSPIEKDIAETFLLVLEQKLCDVSVDRQNAGHAYQDYIAEINEWIRQFDHPLNALAHVIHNHHRGLPPERFGVSEQLADALSRWLGWIEGEVRVGSEGADAQLFVYRAIGLRGQSRSIRWNVDRQAFEGVPWNLAEQVADTPPGDGFSVREWSRGHWRQHLMKFVYEQGFEVAENYPLPQHMPAGKWLCTLSAEKQWAGGETQTVRIWEHPDHEGEFFLQASGKGKSNEATLFRDRLEIFRHVGRAKAEWLPVDGDSNHAVGND